MRLAKLALAVFGFATVLLAADPFVGTWKLDPARSKCKTGTLNKDMTVVIAESGGDLDSDATGTTADGNSYSNHFVAPLKGGAGKIVTSPSPYDAVSARKSGASRRVTTFSKGGKVVYTVTTTVSADGKTLTAAAKGTNAVGKAVDCTNVMAKQ